MNSFLLILFTFSITYSQREFAFNKSIVFKVNSVKKNRFLSMGNPDNLKILINTTTNHSAISSDEGMMINTETKLIMI